MNRSNSATRHRNAEFRRSREIISTQGDIMTAPGSSRAFEVSQCISYIEAFDAFLRSSLSLVFF